MFFNLHIIFKGSLLELQDPGLVQNDIIQNYIETNDVQSMQLPDPNCEISRTLQYYESALLTNPWSFSQHVTLNIFI